VALFFWHLVSQNSGQRVFCGRREGIAMVGPNIQQVSQSFVDKRDNANVRKGWQP
jgi:hypothetical protein